jgi:acetyl esterase
MPLDARLEPLLAQVPTEARTPLLDARDLLEAVARVRAEELALAPTIRNELVGAGPELAEVHDHPVAVDGGQIMVRVYRDADEPLPVFLYLHGGGWWLGDLDSADAFCRTIAKLADCAVVSVDYRRAPEHQFPVPLEDAHAALRWAVDNADALGFDAERVAIGGESAGANIAASLALLARDRGGPALCGQVLDVPALDFTLAQPSIAELGEGYGLTRTETDRCIDLYLGRDTMRTDPLASPLFADVAGLPPALIMTAEFDLLRDDGAAYADRLRAAGVAATLHCWPGMTHGVAHAGKLLPEVTAAYDRETADFLRGAFAAVRGSDPLVPSASLAQSDGSGGELDLDPDW